MSDRLYSSAKVRLCGSWAAKLATRASDVNFTVLLEPRSFFDMVDAKVCTTAAVRSNSSVFLFVTPRVFPSIFQQNRFSGTYKSIDIDMRV